MKRIVLALLFLCAFATTAAVQYLECIAPNKMCRAGAATQFKITDAKNAPFGQGFHVLASLTVWPWIYQATPHSWAFRIYTYPDALFALTVNNVHTPTRFFDAMVGPLNPEREGFFKTLVPNDSRLVGKSFVLQVAITLDPWGALWGVWRVSNALVIWIHP